MADPPLAPLCADPGLSTRWRPSHGTRWGTDITSGSSALAPNQNLISTHKEIPSRPRHLLPKGGKKGKGPQTRAETAGAAWPAPAQPDTLQPGSRPGHWLSLASKSRLRASPVLATQKEVQNNCKILRPPAIRPAHQAGTTLLPRYHNNNNRHQHHYLRTETKMALSLFSTAHWSTAYRVEKK